MRVQASALLRELVCTFAADSSMQAGLLAAMLALLGRCAKAVQDEQVLCAPDGLAPAKCALELLVTHPSGSPAALRAFFWHLAKQPEAWQYGLFAALAAAAQCGGGCGAAEAAQISQLVLPRAVNPSSGSAAWQLLMSDVVLQLVSNKSAEAGDCACECRQALHHACMAPVPYLRQQLLQPPNEGQQHTWVLAQGPGVSAGESWRCLLVGKLRIGAGYTGDCQHDCSLQAYFAERENASSSERSTICVQLRMRQPGAERRPGCKMQFGLLRHSLPALSALAKAVQPWLTQMPAAPAAPAQLVVGAGNARNRTNDPAPAPAPVLLLQPDSNWHTGSEQGGWSAEGASAPAAFQSWQDLGYSESVQEVLAFCCMQVSANVQH